MINAGEIIPGQPGPAAAKQDHGTEARTGTPQQPSRYKKAASGGARPGDRPRPPHSSAERPKSRYIQNDMPTTCAMSISKLRCQRQNKRGKNQHIKMGHEMRIAGLKQYVALAGIHGFTSAALQRPSYCSSARQLTSISRAVEHADNKAVQKGAPGSIPYSSLRI